MGREVGLVYSEGTTVFHVGGMEDKGKPGLDGCCGQADLLDVVGDGEKAIDPRLHLWLDCCAVELCQPFLHKDRARTIRHMSYPSPSPLPSFP